MKVYSKEQIAEYIYNKLVEQKDDIIKQYEATKQDIGYFYIDNILPVDLANYCYEVFPNPSEMRCLKSLREYKYISAQMDKHHKILEDVIYAFQDKKIVQLISEYCGIDRLFADESLYAGGISLMAQGSFLHPHLDNSHDAERDRWRVLNLLYYVTPNWDLQNGGNLELWPNGPKKKPVVLKSKFNRLIVMATHDTSWHSVNKVTVDASRCCISNYYFSDNPLKTTDKFHVTKFRGRPEDTFTNIILDADARLRMLIRKVFKKGVRKNPHIYKKGN
jgi:Rps23 Pro-64 3,4-dihydroxylase Tpa1-like proline 4-hydroxylase